MSNWYIAKSLEKLRTQVNALYPNRSKASDGGIGDANHASRSSDHNPWVKDAAGNGVVTARDITNDPANGLSARKLAETLVASRDPRIKYIISEGQIISSQQQPWVWRKYTGPNGHFHHVHISVVADESLYNDTSDWNLSATGDNSSPTDDTSFYTVKAGDSLWQIAGHFNTTVAALMAANKLLSDIIRPGQRLKVKL